jgi:hypothetical protein
VATQTVVLPELASPQVIGMLKQAAQRGEILYECSLKRDELEEIEISPECDEDNHDDCDDELCECPCHIDDAEGCEEDDIEDETELDPEDETEDSDEFEDDLDPEEDE